MPDFTIFYNLTTMNASENEDMFSMFMSWNAREPSNPTWDCFFLSLLAEHFFAIEFDEAVKSNNTEC